MSKKRGRPISCSEEVLQEVLQNQEDFDYSLVAIKEEQTDDQKAKRQRGWADESQYSKLVKTEIIKSEPMTVKELPADFDITGIPFEQPPKKRRGRKPKPKPPLEEIQPSLLTNTNLPDNVVLKKPRKPRQEKQEHRKPYQKHKKKPINSVSIDPETGGYIIQPNDSDPVENATPQVSELPPVDVRNPADINQMIFQNFFNKRLLKNTTIMQEKAIELFSILDDLKSRQTTSLLNETNKVDRMYDLFKIFHNRFVSLEKNLGSFLIKIMRGFLASKISPIPIQTPWNLRTEVMNHENKSWIELQREINDFYNTINNRNYVESAVTDEDLLAQKATSFFLGRGCDSSKIPGFIYNSEWLNTATGARGDPEMIIVGGGSAETSSMRTHTVIASFRNDLNAGLQLPDAPMTAMRVMTQDKQGVGVNTQRSLPVCDSTVCQ